MNPDRPAQFRVISLALFLVSMPLTVLNSRGPGFFADSDGWQGYEVAFFWPICIVKFGALWFIPNAFSTAYILCGMWLPNAPRFVHVVGAGSCCLTFVVLPIAWGNDLRFEFLLLETSWAFAAIARLIQKPSNNSVEPPAQNPATPPESN
jgi:hypothetical protein